MLGLIFWALILLFALSYFGITVQDIVNSPAGQAFTTYFFALLAQAYQAVIHFIQG